MKFFHFILISSYSFGCWACPCGAQGTPEPLHPLYCLYSKPHSLQPKSGAPNTSCSKQETLAGEAVMFDLSISSPKCLYSRRVGTLHEYVHDPYSLHLSESTHSLNCIFEPPSLDIVLEHPPSTHDNDTLSPKLYGLLSDSLNGILFVDIPFCKSMKFIETKVPAMKLQGFNHYLG